MTNRIHFILLEFIMFAQLEPAVNNLMAVYVSYSNILHVKMTNILLTLAYFVFNLKTSKLKEFLLTKKRILHIPGLFVQAISEKHHKGVTVKYPKSQWLTCKIKLALIEVSFMLLCDLFICLIFCCFVCKVQVRRGVTRHVSALWTSWPKISDLTCCRCDVTKSNHSLLLMYLIKSLYNETF